MLEHLRWADVRVLEALRAAGTPPAEALELFGHVVGAEHVWLARLGGWAAEVAVWPKLSVEECAALAAANANAFDAVVEALDEQALQRVVHYTNSAGLAFESTVEEILTHVCMHGQYHRAQVNLLLRRAGLAPAPVDYIAFTRGAAAATRQA
jgi:uncharacterized damage-inducible protein DinB